jgi:hypothetical protein
MHSVAAAPWCIRLLRRSRNECEDCESIAVVKEEYYEFHYFGAFQLTVFLSSSLLLSPLSPSLYLILT